MSSTADLEKFKKDLKALLFLDVPLPESDFSGRAVLTDREMEDYDTRRYQLDKLKHHKKANEPFISLVITHIDAYLGDVLMLHSHAHTQNTRSIFEESLKGFDFLQNALITALYQGTNIREAVEKELIRKGIERNNS